MVCLFELSCFYYFRELGLYLNPPNLNFLILGHYILVMSYSRITKQLAKKNVTHNIVIVICIIVKIICSRKFKMFLWLINPLTLVSLGTSLIVL